VKAAESYRELNIFAFVLFVSSTYSCDAYLQEQKKYEILLGYFLCSAVFCLSCFFDGWVGMLEHFGLGAAVFFNDQANLRILDKNGNRLSFWNPKLKVLVHLDIKYAHMSNKTFIPTCASFFPFWYFLSRHLSAAHFFLFFTFLFHDKKMESF
jgi:hypothetical protein